MGLLEVSGPVMIGPSSSHTLGALKIARFAYKFSGVPDEVLFALHGSFASTYRGHGTDRALVAGILGIKADSEEVRRAFEIAKERNLNYQFVIEDLGDVHPNTVAIRMKKNGIENEIIGASIGGGAISITAINGIPTALSGDFPTLVVLNKDIPGALESVIRNVSVNIANMYLRRINVLKGEALTIIELDEDISQEEIDLLKSLPAVKELYFVRSDSVEIL